MKPIIFILFLGLSAWLYAQPNVADAKRNATWVLGHGYTMHTKLLFTSDTVTVTTQADTVCPYIACTASAISDTSGHLAFYTNGIYLVNSFHELLASDLTPVAGYSRFCTSTPVYNCFYPVPQSSVILPYPDHHNQYFILHTQLSDSFIVDCVPGKNILTTLVDMNQRNGHGQVVYKNVPILSHRLSGDCCLAACRHANGRDWWIITWESHTNRYMTFLLDPLGVHLQQWRSTDDNVLGYNTAMTFSPDGSKFVITRRYPYPSSARTSDIDLYDFDRCRGILSNARKVRSVSAAPANWYAYNGVCFSGNSRYLYVTTGLKAMQFDMQTSPNLTTCDTVATAYPNSTMGGLNSWYFGFMHLAIDGKIYMQSYNADTLMHVIHRPNTGGTGCNLEQFALHTPVQNDALPNEPNFQLGALTGSSCDTLTVATLNPIEKSTQIQLFPNPASDEITLQAPDGLAAAASLQITDVFGRVLRQETLVAGANKWSVRDLPQGVYVVRIFRATGTVQTAKFTVVR